jgi:hypothetical protein
MFDNLYVLAKGGVCVFSGCPQGLNTHLSECDITCNEFQVPIEVLLKISSKGLNEQKVRGLSERANFFMQPFIRRLTSETKLSSNGITPKIKKFKFKDLWYLLMRNIVHSYIVNWKLQLLQPIVSIFYSLLLVAFFGTNVGETDGCFSSNSSANISCFQTLKEESILEQNSALQLYVVILYMFIQIVVTTLTFPSELRIFFSQHRNRKNFFYIYFILEIYYSID